MLTFIFGQALASVAVLLLASAICVVLRRSSAAHRHLVWLLALTALLWIPLCACLIAPFVPRAQPSIAAPVVTVTAELANRSQHTSSPPGSPRQIPWAAIAGLVWLIGSGVFMIRTAAGVLECERRRRGAVPAEEATAEALSLTERLRMRGRVGVVISNDISVPETFGFRTPVVYCRPRRCNGRRTGCVLCSCTNSFT